MQGLGKEHFATSQCLITWLFSLAQAAGQTVVIATPTAQKELRKDGGKFRSLAVGQDARISP